MIDTDFEKSAYLLTTHGYFDRVRELSRSMSIYEAWEQVERELPFGLRRFTNYRSFERAKTKEAKGVVLVPRFSVE